MARGAVVSGREYPWAARTSKGAECAIFRIFRSIAAVSSNTFRGRGSHPEMLVAVLSRSVSLRVL
jgi:hypothetical protein